MPDEELRARLDELHEQLEQLEHADKVDPEVRASLELLIADVRKVLDRSGEQDVTAEQESVLERLKDAAGQFEESHPVLFGTLGRLMDVLSQMGI
jgi:uncharacterized coiled-coil DUF342 family protein